MVPAVPPSPPTPPSLPPLYQNTTLEIQGITVIETIQIVPPPPLPVEPSNGDGEISIDFVIPTEMRVTMEPHPLVSIGDLVNSPKITNFKIANLNLTHACL